MAVIRSVLGDIGPAEAGLTLTYEHIRCAYTIAATGFYAERMGIGFYWRRKSVDFIADNMMVRDLTEGMVYDNRMIPYRAGVSRIRAARAQRKTGCAIGTRTQPVAEDGMTIVVFTHEISTVRWSMAVLACIRCWASRCAPRSAARQ